MHFTMSNAYILHGELGNTRILNGELSNSCILHGELCEAWYISTTYESWTVGDVLLGYEIKVTLNIISIAF